MAARVVLRFPCKYGRGRMEERCFGTAILGSMAHTGNGLQAVAHDGNFEARISHKRDPRNVDGHNCYFCASFCLHSCQSKASIAALTRNANEDNFFIYVAQSRVAAEVDGFLFNKI